MKRTDPRTRSAPLPDDANVTELPPPGVVRAEIARAGAELLWALHRQRAAWAHFAKLKEHYAGKPNFEFLDNERPWAMAISEVKWWRGEVTSRAATLQALIQLAQFAYPDLALGGDWIETTGYGEMSAGQRTFARRRQ